MQNASHTHALRRLYRPDLELFRDHLLRLDPETRRNRFGLLVSDDYLAQYAELCFASGALTYGYFEDGVVRGGGELRMFPSRAAPNQTDGEAAFSVELPWRRSGIGTQLMGHIVLAAQNRRIQTLTIVCLRQNYAMQRLAKKFSAELEFEMSDVTGHLVARAPTPASLWQEFVDNSLDFGSSLIDYQSRLFHKATEAVHSDK